jgi:large subunit ribosomal protein L24
MASKIRKNDLVEVMRGREESKRGRVIRIDLEKELVWVEKLNIRSRHRKGAAGQKESTIEKKEAPMHISNVMLVDPEADVPTRVGFKLVYEISEEERQRLEAEGQKIQPRKKVRYAKKSGTVLE